MEEKIVVDSFAIIGYFRKENRTQPVSELIQQAENNALLIFIHRINWGEIYYRAYRSGGLSSANRVIKALMELPIEIIDEFGEKVVRQVAQIKGKYPVDYADAFAIHTAISLDARLVTGDPEIQRVAEKEAKLKLIWLGE